MRTRNAAAGLTGLLILVPCLSRGQIVDPLRIAKPSPSEVFEVASIRAATGPGFPMDIAELTVRTLVARNSNGGQFRTQRVPLTFLIQLAYNVKDFQVLGGPAWVSSDRYDVTAKAQGDSTFEQMRPMLQSLLADRFKLVLRHEQKELPVYDLTVAKGDPKIVAAKPGSCAELDRTAPPPPRNSPPPPLACGTFRRGLSADGRDRTEGAAISMPTLTELLSNEVGRTVVDKTHFTAAFDLHLEFVHDGPGGPGAAPVADPGPSIFSAVQEQLGLRLESAKGLVEVLVIDSVERASEN